MLQTLAALKRYLYVLILNYSFDSFAAQRERCQDRTEDQKHKVYASDLGKLGITQLIFPVEGKENKLWMEAGTQQFMIFISSDEQVYSVNNEGLVQMRKQASK